jgi:hypothetical protein
MEYILYFSPSPAPPNLAQEHLDRLIPMRFSSEKDALHGAVLVMRGGQHPWLIAGPGVVLEAQEIAARCEPILRLVRR